MKRIAATLQQQSSDGQSNAEKEGEHAPAGETGQGPSSTPASSGAGGGGDTISSPGINGTEACPSSCKGDNALGVSVPR